MKKLLVFLFSIQTVFAQTDTIRFSQDTVLQDRLFVESNTYITCDSGVWVIIGKKFNDGGIMLIGDSLNPVTNVTFDHVNIDIAARENFQVGIFAKWAENITIKNSNFKNSEDSIARENPGWTLMGTNFRYTRNVSVSNNISDGCQFKMAGANGGIENLTFAYNDIRNCTQMGVSAVVTSNKSPANLINIYIRNNYFKNIDDIAIYIGIDDGHGRYGYKTVVYNVRIEDNVVDTVGQWGGMPRGVQVRGTKDSGKIHVNRNTINAGRSKHSIGIEVKNPDTITMYDIFIHDNIIRDTDNYNIRLFNCRTFEVLRNYTTNGRGILIRQGNGAGGKVYHNHLINPRYGLRIIGGVTDVGKNVVE